MPLKGRSNIDKAIAMMREGANDDVKGVYLAGMKNMIEQTPARKGFARNGWRLTTDSPSKASGGTASINGNMSLNSVQSQMPNVVLGKKLYFTNIEPHTLTLEYGGYPNPVKYGTYIDGRFQKLSAGGYSKQAPGGWVRKTLKLMKNKIRSLR